MVRHYTICAASLWLIATYGIPFKPFMYISDRREHLKCHPVCAAGDHSENT